ncbi:MAG: hypothetical protein LDL24_06810 [Treponema sp.]|nr:hypothetical protein [Treponema sp.]
MKGKFVFLLSFFILPAFMIWGEYAPRVWLQSSASSAYHSVSQELQSLINDAESRRIPENLVLDKLKEGAAKRVPPQQLLQALRTEIDRLTLAMQLLQKGSPVQAAQLESLLKSLSLLLQGGVPVDTIDAVIDYAVMLEKSSTRAVNALSSAFRIIAIAQAPAELLRPLSECLVRSNLSESQFPQIQSFAVRAKSRQILGESMIKLIIGSLDGGYGLVGLDRELQKRSQRP